LLPQALLRVSTRVEGDRIVPHYLTAHDEPWLRSLMDECTRFVGRKRSELHERLREPLPTRAPKAKLRTAIHVLDGRCRERTTSAVPPKEARAAVFREASVTPAPRLAVISGSNARLLVGVGARAPRLHRAFALSRHRIARMACFRTRARTARTMREQTELKTASAIAGHSSNVRSALLGAFAPDSTGRAGVTSVPRARIGELVDVDVSGVRLIIRRVDRKLCAHVVAEVGNRECRTERSVRAQIGARRECGCRARIPRHAKPHRRLRGGQGGTADR
jgi:Protein of unknown function (DUF790)